MFEGFRSELIALSNGVSIQARIGGMGPPVLLLHGYPQTSACWHAAAPRLVAAGFKVIAPDLRGYGASDKPASSDDHSTYSKRTMAADQVELMRHFGYDRFYVAGHDRGGRIVDSRLKCNVYEAGECLGWGKEVEAFPGGVVVAMCGGADEGLAAGFDIGFARQGAAQASDSVFDAAFCHGERTSQKKVWMPV